MSVVDGFGQVPEPRLVAFEQKYGLSLPDDFRRFLAQNNGGRPDRTRFLIPDAGTEALVDRFIGLDTSQSRDLCHWLDRYRDEMPVHFLIIGRDPGGNFLILGCNGSDNPGVYYWDHTHSLPQSSDEENTYFLSDTFAEFLAGLQKESP